MVEKIGSQFSENTCLGLKRFGVYYSKCKREKILGVGCDGIQTERSSDQLPPIKWLVVVIIMTGTMLMIMIDDHNQGAISCATARPPVAASTGALTLAGSPSIHAIVAKSILSRFMRFWMCRFQPFMVMNGYFMIMTLAQGCQR